MEMDLSNCEIRDMLKNSMLLTVGYSVPPGACEKEAQAHLSRAKNCCDPAINMVRRGCEHCISVPCDPAINMVRRGCEHCISVPCDPAINMVQRGCEHFVTGQVLNHWKKINQKKYNNENEMTGSFNEQMNAEHKDQHREKPDSEVGYYDRYFDDSRNGERNIVHTAPENFGNTSFLRCIPREWLELTPYQHARLMAPLLMANACLQRKRYTYKEVIKNEDTPVQNFISFLKRAVKILYHPDYIAIGNTFGKIRSDNKVAGKFVKADRQLEDSAAGEPAAEKRQKLEAKWGMQVHYRLSEKAWNSYLTGVNKNKRRKTLQFGIFFTSDDDVKTREKTNGTALLIPLKKHAINICERLMSKLEIHCEKQELEQQLIIDLVTEIIISQQEEVADDIHELGSFETIDEDDRFHRALGSICVIIGHLIYNSIILIRQGTFFKQDDETNKLKSTLAGVDSDSSGAGS